jgi:hypothetical protein
MQWWRLSRNLSEVPIPISCGRIFRRLCITLPITCGDGTDSKISVCPVNSGEWEKLLHNFEKAKSTKGNNGSSIDPYLLNLNVIHTRNKTPQEL